MNRYYRIGRRRGRPFFLLACIALAACSEPPADPANASQVQRGQVVYAQHCASCHGANLEGQPNWKQRLANGRLPAPPHDASGHTWHHPDRALFEVTKNGAASVAGSKYESDMPAFRGALSDDEIWAVLAFIKSRWPSAIRDKQAQINARGGRH